MPNILTHITERQVARFGADRTAYTTINYDAATLDTTSWGEFASVVENVACALASLGLDSAQMVAVFAPNCPEIIITDFACYRNRAVPVAIYSTSSPEQVQYIVNDAGCRFIMVGEKEQYRAARAVKNNCPTLLKIVVISSDVELDADDTDSIYFRDFVELGANVSDEVRQEVKRRAAAATPDDIATLIYTSGTTGQPKGAILPHSCFNAAIDFHERRLDMVSNDDTSVCFLPLSHIFEKAWTYYCLSQGMRVDINPNPRRIQEGIRISRPNCMCSVPRFWEKVYAAVQEKFSSMKGLQKKLVDRALVVGAKRNLEYKRLGLKVPALLEMQYKFFDKMVFDKVRRTIGVENGKLFPTAGAPLSSTIVEFMHSIGINICIGYGLSETTATVSCFPVIGYEIGTVGTVLDGIQVKIGENNEILVKSPTVMRGYYGRPEEDAKAFTPDGWFRTGDAGMFDQNHALILTERIKDLFKTSNGKYIAPQAIESRLGADPYIEQVAVIGDQRKYVTAIIVPAFAALKDYARSRSINFESIEDLVQNTEIYKFIAERIEELQHGFAPFEKIKRFTLLPKELTIESGELTNTLKIRRPAINTIYADQIEAMYR